jgi:CAAX protease family protein
MAFIRSASSAPQSRTHRLFFGRDELRAGWRLLIYLAIVSALILLGNAIARTIVGNGGGLSAQFTRKVVNAVAFLSAAWIMAKGERRTLADYGLPWGRTFGPRFLQGILIGFVAVTLMVVCMRATPAIQIAGVASHETEVLKWGGLYAVAFVLAGLEEEFRFRGYTLFTTATGMGFWPAATLFAVLFGASHLSNTGETWVGSLNAALAGLVFAFFLRRTGNLWLPIGMHAAWNWTESYFYGATVSGQSLPGRLLNSTSSGPLWLTGGTVGPEGSVFCTFVLIGIWLVGHAWLRKAEYATSAGPHKMKDPR